MATEQGDLYTEKEIIAGLIAMKNQIVKVRVAVGSVYVKVSGKLAIICDDIYEIVDSDGLEISFDLPDVRCINSKKRYILLGPGLNQYLPEAQQWPEFITLDA